MCVRLDFSHQTYADSTASKIRVDIDSANTTCTADVVSPRWRSIRVNIEATNAHKALSLETSKQHFALLIEAIGSISVIGHKSGQVVVTFVFCVIDQ